ncbi:MAG: thioredoxin domain-containing protein [Bacteroidales bacterium]|jgi:uncharacterized membrane protein|nr:thioredoxin domain-containing protein [Bacteroidales bacterium]
MKNILEHILSALKIKHTELYAKKLYREHPFKDKLYGISKMLADYDNKSTIVEIADKDVKSLEIPSVVNLGGHNVLVHEMTLDDAKVLWNHGEIKILFKDFHQLWDGKAIFLKPGKGSKEPDYKENLKKQWYNTARKNLLYIIAGLVLVSGFIYNKLFMQPGLMASFAVNVIGIYISYLLVQKQMHIHNDRADKICSMLGKSGCNGILESPAAKLFGIIGWSEVGLSYFTSNILIVTVFPGLIPYMALINLCALPYSFWSVWYQKFRAKEWCTLCLIVQVLLWLVFAVNFVFAYITIPSFCINDMLLTAIVYLIPFLTISLLLPVWNSGEQIQQITGILNTIKAKPEVFVTLLMRQPRYKINDLVSQIHWGNKNAEIQITIVTNPYCGYCAVMHQRIEKLLEKIGDKISVWYVFAFDKNTEAGSKFLTAVYLDERLTAGKKKEIFDEWYRDTKNRNDRFFRKYDVNINNEAVKQEIEKHQQWCEQTKNYATPTVLVDGHKLPENYTIEDIIWFTDIKLQ